MIHVNFYCFSASKIFFFGTFCLEILEASSAQESVNLICYATEWSLPNAIDIAAYNFTAIVYRTIHGIMHV